MLSVFLMLYVMVDIHMYHLCESITIYYICIDVLQPGLG